MDDTTYLIWAAMLVPGHTHHAGGGMAKTSSNDNRSTTLIAVGLVIAIVVLGRTARSTWDSWSRDRESDTDRILADPAAILVDGALHVYSTSAPSCGPDDGGCPTYWVPHFASGSLSEAGTLQGDAMPDRPAWVHPDRRAIWAPSVVRIGDGYVMYYAASAAAGPKCIGVAHSATPTGPFQPSPHAFACADSGYWAIDPYAFTDGANWYLLWREDDHAHVRGKIVGVQLTPDGLGFAGPTKPTLVVGEADWENGSRREPAESDTGRQLPEEATMPGGGIGPIENPAMARHPETGEWLLTWSANRWDTPSYATGLARCHGPLGPCERLSRDQPWLRTSEDSAISTDATFTGAGGLSFLGGSDGRLYAMFHAYRGSDGASESNRIGWIYRVDRFGDEYVLRQF